MALQAKRHDIHCECSKSGDRFLVESYRDKIQRWLLSESYRWFESCYSSGWQYVSAWTVWLYKNTVTGRGIECWGHVWCNGQHVCFPGERLPPMPESRFKSLGLIFGLRYVSEVHQGFSPDTLVSSPPSLVNGFSQWNKARLNVISSWAVLLYNVAYSMLHTISVWGVACDLYMVAPCTFECRCRRRFTVQWGDCNKISNCAFQYHSSSSSWIWYTASVSMWQCMKFSK